MSRKIEIILFYSVFVLLMSKHMMLCRKRNSFGTTKKNRQEKCYDGLGCVALTPEWWNSKHRPMNVLPSDRFAINTLFILWKLNNGSVYPEIMNDHNIQCSNKILIHDFTSNGYTGWIQYLSRALLVRRDVSDVVSVNWAAGAEPPYLQAVANARLVALEVIHFLNKIKDKCDLLPSKVHIIGHGLGAHIAGYVGKMNKLERITALDPSGPYFMNMPANVRLHKTDAFFVEVVHTDIMPDGQGFPGVLGHVDFYPNGGKNQPGCVDPSLKVTQIRRNHLTLGETLSACSHKRGLKYYIEALVHPTCSFLGFSCSNFKEFMKGKCSTCGENLQYCIRMPVIPSKIGELNNTHGFYFVTSTSSPYCVEMLKTLLVIKSGVSEQTFVKGYFNITIPQAIGDVNFLINENHVLNTLSTNDNHLFMVFRTVPPPLLVPSEAVHIKWIQGPLRSPWSNPPQVTGFMIYKMANAMSRPQWFCPVNASPHLSLGFGLGLEPCTQSETQQNVKQCTLT